MNSKKKKRKVSSKALKIWLLILLGHDNGYPSWQDQGYCKSTSNLYFHTNTKYLNLKFAQLLLV